MCAANFIYTRASQSSLNCHCLLSMPHDKYSSWSWWNTYYKLLIPHWNSSPNILVYKIKLLFNVFVAISVVLQRNNTCVKVFVMAAVVLWGIWANKKYVTQTEVKIYCCPQLRHVQYGYRQWLHCSVLLCRQAENNAAQPVFTVTLFNKKWHDSCLSNYLFQNVSQRLKVYLQYIMDSWMR